MSRQKQIFKNFTNQYSLSKTLRFELKPVGETLKKMREHLEYDPKLRTFLKGRRVENAYQLLKPLIDDLHEEFITVSLESEAAQAIDFSAYLVKYRQKQDDRGEKNLRAKIGELYKAGEAWLRQQYPQLQFKKGSNKASSFNVLLSQDLLAVIRDRYKHDDKVQEAIAAFAKFYTYFQGFNQNRENYYVTKEEKATAVATRIVHDNLPKFCDNAIQFAAREDEYLGIYAYLTARGVDTRIKNTRGELAATSPLDARYFAIDYFNHCLSQRQIDVYNQVISQYNFLINLYNQNKQVEEKQLPKSERTYKKLPQFKTLYKQIGCGKRESLFFKLEYDREADVKVEDKKDANTVLSVERVLHLAANAGEKYFADKESSDRVHATLFAVLDYLRKHHGDWSGIYWSNRAINTISNKYFANWHVIIEQIADSPKQYATVATYDRKREQSVKLNDAVELKGLFAILDQTVDTQTEKWWEAFFKKSIYEDAEKLSIIQQEQTPSVALMALLLADIQQHAVAFNATSAKILQLQDYKSAESKQQIKAWMDDALAVNRMLKYFLVKESKAKGDTPNSELVNMINTVLVGANGEVEWFKWYDALRNYLTKKPQDDAKENKSKLNFDKGNLLNGFVDNQTKSDNGTQYGGYLFRKYSDELNRYEYYLGISTDAKLFRCRLQNEVSDSDKSDYNRLEYYQPKSTTFFSDEYSKNKEKLIQCISNKIKGVVQKLKQSVIDDKKKIEEIESVEEKLLKGDTPTKLLDNITKEKKCLEFKNILADNELLELINETVDEIKHFIKNYQNRIPALSEVQEKQYQSISGLKEIIDDLQKIAKETKVYNYFPVSQKEFKEVCGRDKKPLFLFKIVNKDLTKKKKTEENEQKNTGRNSAKNLHTLYFEAMMSGNQKVIDLGKGEIFYRKSAIQEKKTKDGYEEKPWVIKEKRFTDNDFLLEKNKEKSECDGKSFFLHLSVSLNYVQNGYADINQRVNDNFVNVDNLYFLGLDRGEKHLIYYSLVDANGNLCEQGSLNVINGHDYHHKLDEREGQRQEARKNWQTIGKIKNLKEGYISQVIHEIVKKVTNKPTFIVLEDLNTDFKRGRQKIEKQVYQKFELALAKKLNFVVDKTKEVGEIGSVTKALQLTPPVANYQDIENKKQVGVMLYTRANYTSLTDPLTGWRKSIYLQRGTEKKIKEQIGKKFNDVRFENNHYYFEYTDENTGKKWRLWSGHNGKPLTRYRGKRDNEHNMWTAEEINVEEKLKQLFAETEFDYERSLYSQLFSEEKKLQKIPKDKHTAWESLRFVIDLIQQIRNSGDTSKGQDDNFLQSPIRDENGNHFDSREYEQQGKPNFPKDADANGAYNIARKGVIMNAHIRRWQQDGAKEKDLDLYISDYEWDLWLNDREKWEKMLPTFASRNKMREFRNKR